MEVSFSQYSPPDETTAIPGELIVTTEPNLISAPVEANKRKLSYQLADVYFYSTNYYLPVIQHVPFLIGKGWDKGGATFAEAESICNSLGITPLTLMPGSDSTGYVVEQSLDAGKLLAGTGTVPMSVKLKADVGPSGGGTSTAITASAPGSDWISAISIAASGADPTATASGSMTPLHNDLVSSPLFTDGKARSDLFFRLPDAAAGRTVTVSQVNGSDRAALTVWQLQSGTLKPIPWLGNAYTSKLAYCPQMLFFQPSTDCFVTVEFASRNLGSIDLKFDW
jgi:hypothetical protein